MADMRLNIMRLYFTCGGALLALLLGACAGNTILSSRLPLLSGQSHSRPPDLDVRAVSPEMEAFLSRYIENTESLDKRAWNLVWAATDRNVLPFDYDPGVTLTSTEAFSSRTGNCLSFANMLVAMARRIGLDAWYQEVEIPPQWSSAKNTLLISMHVNVVVRGKHDQWVVDISGENAGASRKIRRMTDSEALAQHYNNLGSDALIEDDLPKAYGYYEKAIAIAPHLPYLWSNLGVVYNRNDQNDDAVMAYKEALTLDPLQPNAMNNLFLIYEKTDNRAAAQNLQQKVDRHRRKNPYYLYFLSSQAAQMGRYDESAAMLRKAIRMNGYEYRFHYELARVQALDGNMEAAKASLERAIQLAPNSSLIRQASLDSLPELPD